MQKRLVGLITLASIATLFFASCGQKGGAGADMIFNNGAEPQSLDPALTSGVPEARLCYSLFEGLTVNDPQTSKAVPGIAESWKVSADQKTYTFKLRNAKFSDGKKITAQDFVDSWLRVLDPKTAAAYAYIIGDSVEGAGAYNSGKGPKEGVKIKAVNDGTLEVTFVGPLPYALDMLTHNAFVVTPSHAIAKFGADWVKPANFVGSGPFVLKDWKPQDKIVVVKNDKYWDAKNVKLKSLTYLAIEDQSVAYDKFKAGEIDWLADDSVPPAKIDEIKLRPDYHMTAGSSVYYYIYNVTKKPFDNVKVRKAFAMAVDRKAIVEDVLKAGDVASAGFVPAMGGFNTTKGNEFNLDEAKKLLAEACYPNGKGFPKTTLIYNTNARHKIIAEFVQQAWKKNLGVDIQLQNLEWNTFLDTRQKTHEFQFTRAGWLADYLDPGNYLDMFKTGSGNNDGLYTNPKYDELLAKAATLAAGDERNKTLQAAEEILITDDQAIAPFFFYANKSLVDLNKWSGVFSNAMDIHPTKWIAKK
jgi:oligopeptide transport system substrate-binding protein